MAVAAVVAVVGAAVLLVAFARQVARTTGSVARVQEARFQLQGTLAAVEEAAADERAYILTGEERFRTPIKARVTDVRQRLRQLARLTAGDSGQRRLLLILKRAADTELHNVARVTMLRSQAGMVVVAPNELLGELGAEKLTDLRGLVDRMDARENFLLRRRLERARAAVRRADVGAALAGLLAALAVGALVLLARRAMRERERLASQRAEALDRAEAARMEAERASERLRESEQRLRLALEAAGMVAWELDVATNDVRRWHGGEGESVPVVERRETLLHVIHPEDRERVRDCVDAAAAGREELDVRYRIDLPSAATPRWIHDRGRLLPGRRFLAGISRDVTEQRQGELEREELLGLAQHERDNARRLATSVQSQRRWLEEVLNLLPVPLFFIEPGSARVTFANHAADAFVGGSFPRARSPEEYGTAWLCTDPGGRGLVIHELPALRVARGERLNGFEMVWHLATGSRPLLFWADTLPAMYGNPATGLVVFQDIARVKEVEAELRRANEAKDDFLAMLGHELRNPLAAVRTAVSVARLDDRRRPHALELAGRQTDQLVRLVDDLLDVARITRGRITLRRRPVSLAAVVQGAVEATQTALDDRHQQVHLSLPADPLEVNADPTRLEQILVNLLENAAKYTPSSGHVTVRVGREGEEAVVRVRDSGMGITPELLPHVFDLFAQGERPLDRAPGGLGIGLTLVRRLVELHDGRVEASSEGPGRGSEFVVRLPALRRPATTAPRERRDVPERPERVRVLIVEDNHDTADSLAMLLETIGHDVRVAYDGERALELAAGDPPDVMLVDIGLPGMDGYEVSRRVRQDPRLTHVLLVALTGYGRAQDRERALAAGFQHHLVKPVDADALNALVAGRHGAGSATLH
jgi:signal transduction histidine kinase/CheY-like chemotaxis protein/CHASE3 domain sensor protein